MANFTLLLHDIVENSNVVLIVKKLSANAGHPEDTGLFPGSRRSPGGGPGNPCQVFLPGESHGQWSLTGYSPCSLSGSTVHGVAESDTTDVTEHACMHVNAVIFSPVQFLCFVAKDPTSQTISVPIHQEDHTGRV